MVFTEKLPSETQFYDLFQTTNWNEKYELSSDELFASLRNSWYTFSVFENNQLIGFGRIISDGVVHALILDVIIHPKKQRIGLGKKVMELLIAKCKEYKIRDIQLFSAKDKAGFYKKLGFEERKDHSPGMELIKYW